MTESGGSFLKFFQKLIIFENSKTSKNCGIWCITAVFTPSMSTNVALKVVNSLLVQKTTPDVISKNGLIVRKFTKFQKLNSLKKTFFESDEKQICRLVFLALYTTRKKFKKMSKTNRIVSF